MPLADHILCMENGAIVERGTYAELIADDGTFARLARDFGGNRDSADSETVMREKDVDVAKVVEEEEEAGVAPKKQAGMMQVEERATGAVSKGGGSFHPVETLLSLTPLSPFLSRSVYRSYLKAANGFFLVPLVALAAICMQAGTLLSQFDLTWWQENKWHRGKDSEAFYVRHRPLSSDSA